MPKAETLKIRLPAHEKNAPLLGRETVIIKVPVKKSWIHTAELDYVKPKDWDNTRTITYLLQNGFSISPDDPSTPWVTVTGRDGEITILPQGYRTPLMFTAKFQWESLRLVMTSASPHKEWEEYKYDILHVSRLCARFLEEARNAQYAAGFDEGWRSKMFDRALTRYYRRWLVNRPEFLKDFWREFGEKEYTKDVLQHDWTRFVLKGHKGFRITREEITNGISFEEFTDGLHILHEAVTSFATNPCSPMWIIGPRDVMGPRDARSRKQARSIFKTFRNRKGHSSWGHAAMNFDLESPGLHSDIPPSLMSSDPSSAATLHIKREIMEVPLDPPNHVKRLPKDPPVMRILTLEPPQENAVLTQMQELSVHDSRVPDHSPFVRRYQRSPPPDEESPRPFPQVLEKIVSVLVERAPERKQLSAAAAQDHQSPPPIDVAMDDDCTLTASNQQNTVVNMAFSALSAISSPKASSEEGRRVDLLSAGAASKRDDPLRMSVGKRIRSTLGGSSTDVHMTDMVSKPSTKTSVGARDLNMWDLNLESRVKYYLELARKINDSEGRIDQHVLTDVASVFAKAGSRSRATSVVNAPTQELMNAPRQPCKVFIPASKDPLSANANIEQNDPLPNDPIPRNPIAEVRRVSPAQIQTIASTSFKASMFQETSSLILESIETEDKNILAPSEHSSKAVSPFVPGSSSRSTKPDTTLVSELLDEIKGLKQLLHENSTSKLDRNADVKRLRAQMNDLHHTFVYQQSSLRGMSVFSLDAETTSTGSTPRDRTPRSQHPLAHLLSAEADVLLGESLPFSHIFIEPKQGSSALSANEPHSPQPSVSEIMTSPPHNDVPLPVKSQRKHRIFFPDHVHSAELMG